MSLLFIILILAAVGVALYLINTYVDFIDPKFKRLINIVSIIITIIWLIKVSGLLKYMNEIKL